MEEWLWWQVRWKELRAIWTINGGDLHLWKAKCGCTGASGGIWFEFKPTGYFEPYDPERLMASHRVQKFFFITKSLSCLMRNNSIGLATNIFRAQQRDTAHYRSCFWLYRNGNCCLRQASSFLYWRTFHLQARALQSHVCLREHYVRFAICYEGFYPYLTNDFSQFEALKSWTWRRCCGVWEDRCIECAGRRCILVEKVWV